MMGRLALGWLVLTLTSSPFLVGLAAAMEGVGKVGFGIFAGALVDRLNKRTLFIAGLLTNGVIGLALGLLLVSGRLELWHVLLAALVQGAGDSLLASCSNTMLYQIVGRSRVVNASATKMFSFNLARITGSALAGLVIDRWGLELCFLLAGGLACASALPALFIRGHFAAARASEPMLRSIKDGLRYAWEHAPVRQLLTLSVVVEMFGFAHYTMVPVIARDVLHVGATELGWLSSVAGMGALLGTVGVASLGDFKNKGGLLMSVTAGAGLGVVVFALSPWYGVSLALSLLLGAALTSYDVLMHALFQLISSDAVRGRVFSLYVLTFGFHPLGGFLAGWLASLAGAPLAVGLGGAAIVAYCLKARHQVREIRPSAAEAAQTAGD
jgi:MFS family permease